MTATQSSFGEWLRQHRLAAGLSQEELAERAGLSARGISDLERGIRRKPQRETVRLLAEALKLPEQQWRPFDTAVDRRRGRAAAGDASTTATAVKLLQSGIPVPSTTLVGREREAERIRGMLLGPDIRLLTLTGTGGTGKTRLALRVASELANEFPDGAHFVPLASITDPVLVGTEVARTLGLVESGDRSPRDRLREYLRDRRLLLVLDNLEQVLEAAELVADHLASAPGLVVLVTSRAPLRLSGEHEFPVPPLAVPDAESSLPPGELAGYEAVSLFRHRARSVSPDFTLTESNAFAVAEICRRLDGLPLAIELAAARTKLLPPQAMLGRLEKKLGFLTGGARDLPERQRTMRAAIDWSYELLGEDERRVFARLGVFSGGCTLDAAEAVCGAEGELDTDILDLLGVLVDNSLLLQEEREGDEPRFRMLETIHEYALERLGKSGEAEEIRRRHARYYVGMAETAEPELRRPAQLEWMDRLEVEQDNFRTALSWSFTVGDPECGIRLACSLPGYWQVVGQFTQGRRWVKKALEMHRSVPSNLHAKLLYRAGSLAFHQDDYEESVDFLEYSRTLYGALHDLRGVFDALWCLGGVRAFRSEVSVAKTTYEECLRLARELGDQERLLWARWGLAAVVQGEGNVELSMQILEEGLPRARDLGERRLIGHYLDSIGCLAAELGDHGRAAALLEEGLALLRQMRNKTSVAGTLLSLTELALHRGDHERANELIEESRALLVEAGDRSMTWYLLYLLGEIARSRHEYGQAHLHHAEGLRLILPTSNRHGISISLEAIACIEAARGRTERAIRVWAAADALRESIGIPPSVMERSHYEPCMVSTRSGIDAETWSVVWEEGRMMSPEQAVEYASANPQ